jgi:VanZ family protein
VWTISCFASELIVSLRAAIFCFASYLALAFFVTHLPGSSLPEVGFSHWVPDADKVAHVGLYFVLAGLMANCLRFRLRSNRVIVVVTLGLLAAYAAFDEWSQQFSPLRSPDVYDFIADMVGAAVGVSSFAVWRWARHRARRTARSGASESRGGNEESSLVVVPNSSGEHAHVSPVPVLHSEADGGRGRAIAVERV